MPDKKTARITVWMPESLELDVMRLAVRDDRKLSEYITHVLSLHVYGHARADAMENNVANSGASSEI